MMYYDMYYLIGSGDSVVKYFLVAKLCRRVQLLTVRGLLLITFGLS